MIATKEQSRNMMVADNLHGIRRISFFYSPLQSKKKFQPSLVLEVEMPYLEFQ